MRVLFQRSLSAAPRSRDAVYPGKPNHILGLGCKIQGMRLLNTYPNSHVNTLKSQLWERLLQVIGMNAMFKLLLETSIFIRLGAAAGKKDQMQYYQLSGEFCSGYDLLLRQLQLPVLPPFPVIIQFPQRYVHLQTNQTDFLLQAPRSRILSTIRLPWWFLTGAVVVAAATVRSSRTQTRNRTEKLCF